MRRHTLPEVATQRQKRREHGDEPPLQPARRADADQLTQEEPEIEAARVDQRHGRSVVQFSRMSKSDTPRVAGGLVSGAASKAVVPFGLTRRARARLGG